jgi:hypothetical protein
MDTNIKNLVKIKGDADLNILAKKMEVMKGGSLMAYGIDQQGWMGQDVLIKIKSVLMDSHQELRIDHLKENLGIAFIVNKTAQI